MGNQDLHSETRFFHTRAAGALTTLNRLPHATLLGLTLLGSLALGCSSDDDSKGDSTDIGAPSGGSTVRATTQLSLTGLEPLGGGYEYEGWFILEDGPVSAGRFNLEADSGDIEVEVDAGAAADAMAYVLTIEPPVAEDEPEPSATHILAGAWDGREATLSIDHEAALSDDFAEAMGQFFLQTPTSAEADDDSLGIWFITPGDPMTAGLSLPELPEGWAYEGWVAGPDGPISTGRFVDPAGVDDDAGGPDAGDEPAPPFPGQDFIEPPLDLLGADYAAVISIEPEPDDSAAPFAFKPLVGMIADEDPGGVQMMERQVSSAPEGTVALME